jgi:peptidoglycan hydrolase CwlO-like protein
MTNINNIMELDFLKWAIGIAIIVIGYFLNDVFKRFQNLNEKTDVSISKFKEEHGKLKGEINLLKTQMPSDIKNLEKVMDLKFDEIKKMISHTEQTIKTNSQAFTLLYEEMKKNNK